MASYQGRDQVESHLEGIDLLILDSITTLCPGSGSENEAESWESMQTWLLSLRRQDVTVLLAHHDGKGGQQRGTSKREDVLSQVIQLRRPHDYCPSEGARFEVHFSKARGLLGDDVKPFEAHLTGGPSGTDTWTWKLLDDVRANQMQELVDSGMSQRDVANEMRVSQGTVSKSLKRLRELGDS